MGNPFMKKRQCPGLHLGTSLILWIFFLLSFNWLVHYLSHTALLYSITFVIFVMENITTVRLSRIYQTLRLVSDMFIIYICGTQRSGDNIDDLTQTS